MKLNSLLAVSLAALTLSGCSLLRKQEASTVNSGDALPLYPVTVYTEATLGGHWFINTVGTITLDGYDDEDWPFIEFVPTEGRFYGNNGCNVINGSYHVDGGQSIALSEIATTMRLCESDSLEFPIARALDSTRSFAVSTTRQGLTILTLRNAKNATVMTLSKSDIEFLNGAWQVTAINGDKIDNQDVRLVFDTAENTVNGNTGCNRLKGDILREAKSAGSLSISNLSTTRRMCPDLNVEQSLLIALEEVNTARRSDKGSVDLLSSSGRVVIHLVKLDKSDLK